MRYKKKECCKIILIFLMQQSFTGIFLHSFSLFAHDELAETPLLKGVSADK